MARDNDLVNGCRYQENHPDSQCSRSRVDFRLDDPTSESYRGSGQMVASLTGRARRLSIILGTTLGSVLMLLPTDVISRDAIFLDRHIEDKRLIDINQQAEQRSTAIGHEAPSAVPESPDVAPSRHYLVVQGRPLSGAKQTHGAGGVRPVMRCCLAHIRSAPASP
jgi:hypothetical protein